MEIKPAQMGHHIKMHELADFPALRDGATKWYKFDARSRQYHNLAHAHRVMAAIRQLTADAGPTLYLAALWHDAVYIPGAGGNVNEAASAAALYHTYMQSEARSPQRDAIVRVAMHYIHNTTIAHHLSPRRPKSIEQRVLMDADLSSLADPYPEFVRTQRKIIRENKGDPDDRIALVATSDFLNRLVNARTFVFHTSKARTFWERQARSNIAEFCAMVLRKRA
jgi:predicted metal-dependent HD superfamily phosphohydrolase